VFITPSHSTQKKLNWGISGLDVKAEWIKVLEESIGEYFHEFGDKPKIFKTPLSPNYQRKLFINLVKEVHIIYILKTSLRMWIGKSLAEKPILWAALISYMLLMLSHIIHIFTFYAQRYTYMCDTACLYTKGLYPECIRSSYNLIEIDKQLNF
jgi:hypothetical protein